MVSLRLELSARRRLWHVQLQTFRIPYRYVFNEDGWRIEWWFGTFGAWDHMDPF